MKKLLKQSKFSGAWKVVAGLVAVALSSCTGIFEYEGDCSVDYLLRFRYDKNLKWADAFANEVKSVHVYAFDASGRLAGEFTARGAELATEGYAMPLSLPAGSYHLVAWCGTENEGAARQFEVPAVTVGTTVPGDVTCRIRRGAIDPYASASAERLEFMFHGELDVDLPAQLVGGGEHVETIYLTKDTNHIRIILQQLSGEDTDPDDFEFRIEDTNGFYASDNSLLADEELTYLPFSTGSGVADVGKVDTKAVMNVRGAIADLSVGRLMADHARDMYLTIRNRTNGETVAQIPLIQYALLSKDYYEMAYGHRMDDQEFLDREDEYVLTFFLDENRRWLDSSILIHSWRIVLHDYDLK